MDKYKRIAWFYDIILHVAIIKVRKKITEIIDQHEGNKLIDLCCGTGNQLSYLKKKGYKDLMGVDISPSMLKQANKGRLKGTCKNQNATALDFETNRFDIGIIGYALHEKPFEIARKILSEAERVVKPGGLLILLDFNDHNKVPVYIKAMVHVIERFAGKDHYKNFRSYQRLGGLPKLLSGQQPREEHQYHQGITLLQVYTVKPRLRK